MVFLTMVRYHISIYLLAYLLSSSQACIAVTREVRNGDWGLAEPDKHVSEPWNLNLIPLNVGRPTAKITSD